MVVAECVVCFFCSSRRRHTRSLRDWSSDVCSSDLATLDRLSGGRLTLGVGLGSDRSGGELSKTGEEIDDRLRGQMLDESLEILTAAWSGQQVYHHGPHYTVDGIQFLPGP